MTTATLPRLSTAPSGPSRLMSVVADIFEGISEGRAMAHRYDRLSRLSNGELAQLGLTRQDIPRAVVNGLAGF
jgi:hypothetical protein